MLNDIARVFSSQGILVPGSEPGPVSGRPDPSRACDHAGGECGCFGPKFDQASAKLELSARGRSLREGTGARGEPLDPEERKTVRELAKRDREVKAHEAAHQAAAGGQSRGGANYEYQTGPDGKKYAVGGHVDIDVSPVEGNPRATLAKAMTAQRAALAPADPSGQDRAVAAAAAQTALRAQREMAEGKGAEGRESGKGETGERDAQDAGAGAVEVAEAAGNGGREPARAGRIRAYGRAYATGAALNVRA